MNRQSTPAARSGSIAGQRVVLRPLEPGDLTFVRGALADPTVAQWWDIGDGAAWVDALLDDDEVHPYVVEIDGDPVGYAQWSEETDPGYRHAAIDLFLVATAQGRGLGRDVVRTLARWLFEVRGHHRIEIDPAADNTRAIRCYQAVGFEPVGVARDRERGPDGTWRDSLLMDLLANELA